jgi:hypothetical protein
VYDVSKSVYQESMPGRNVHAIIIFIILDKLFSRM